MQVIHFACITLRAFSISMGRKTRTSCRLRRQGTTWQGGLRGPGQKWGSIVRGVCHTDVISSCACTLWRRWFQFLGCPLFLSLCQERDKQTFDKAPLPCSRVSHFSIKLLRLLFVCRIFHRKLWTSVDSHSRAKTVCVGADVSSLRNEITCRTIVMHYRVDFVPNIMTFT